MTKDLYGARYFMEVKIQLQDDIDYLIICIFYVNYMNYLMNMCLRRNISYKIVRRIDIQICVIACFETECQLFFFFIFIYFSNFNFLHPLIFMFNVFSPPNANQRETFSVYE